MKTLLTLVWSLLTLVSLPAGEVVTLITSPIVPQPPVQEVQSQSATITLA